MIEEALDRYNRTRPLGQKPMRITQLAEEVNLKIGKKITNSSLTSMKQTFRRIDTGLQDTIPMPVLVALSEIFAVDFNTLIQYWIDNNTSNT